MTALDLAPRAIERARAKAAASRLQGCDFEVRDFLADDPPTGPFELVFDRGCFHVFDQPVQQASFAARVASVLAPGGIWLSLIGSTEGPAREFGPPRRSARDVIEAMEPALALLTIRAVEFAPPQGGEGALRPKAWYCVTQRRHEPAQPSTTQ